MQIHITQSDAPHTPKEILVELSAMSPRVFMQWNPRVFKVGDYRQTWEGRWEIWCELMYSGHPEAKNTLAKTDSWNTDAQCWMRKLQVYQTEGGDFAPVDRALIVGLKMADTWADRLFYKNNIEDPYEREEIRQVSRRVEAASGGAAHYRNFNNPTVGAHASKHGRAGWRHRIR